MTLSVRSIVTISVLLALTICRGAQAESGWIEVDASTPFYDADGVLRRPSCSGGPTLMPAGTGVQAIPADTAYSFFFRPGDPDKLAIFWDGGGACWDPNTCIGSALLGDPVYALTVDETVEELDAAPGLADFLNPANPIRSYTQVFIPYCSADLHAGARDAVYRLQAPDGSEIPWLIHHRGYDNVVAVLTWLAGYYEDGGYGAPSDVFLAGASAGGYGVLYGYPAVADLLPWYTRTRVLVDAANGVINQDFYDRALAPGGAWGVWANLAPELVGAFSSGPDDLAIEIFKALAQNHPRTRFGQYTTAFDTVQIGFYNIARHVDNPELWTDPFQLAIAGIDWTLRARNYMLLSALQAWNYRFYLAGGLDHTIVGDNKYYTERSARGVYFSDWVDDMINRRWPWGSAWRNLSCSPDCLP